MGWSVCLGAASGPRSGRLGGRSPAQPLAAQARPLARQAPQQAQATPG